MDNAINSTTEALIAPKKVRKPWGYELHYAHTERYVGKVLHINAGTRLSLQYHERKDETIFLLKGKMEFQIGKPGDDVETLILEEGQGFRIRPGWVHRMEAVEDCDVLEASTPELDDVVRLEDDFGREGTSEP